MYIWKHLHVKSMLVWINHMSLYSLQATQFLTELAMLYVIYIYMCVCVCNWHKELAMCSISPFQLSLFVIDPCIESCNTDNRIWSLLIVFVTARDLHMTRIHSLLQVWSSFTSENCLHLAASTPAHLSVLNVWIDNLRRENTRKAFPSVSQLRVQHFTEFQPNFD